MQKIFGIVAIAAMTAALPQLALAQSSSQGQSSASTQARVKSNLEQAGFTNIRIMPDSFLVRATDKDGNPVMMVINPDSITAITAVSGAQGNSASQGQQGQTTTSRSAKMTDNQRNSGSQQQAEQAATPSQSAKMNGTVTETDEQSPLKLTVAQRAEIWRHLGNQATENAPGFEPKIGEPVPTRLHLKSLPRNVSSQVPAVQPYEYAMLHSQLLIVDPSTKKIVAIITE